VVVRLENLMLKNNYYLACRKPLKHARYFWPVTGKHQYLVSITCNIIDEQGGTGSAWK
jgi:hypothetical protein